MPEIKWKNACEGQQELTDGRGIWQRKYEIKNLREQLIKGMHCIAVVQIVTDAAQHYTKYSLYYCDLPIYITLFSKRGVAHGHKEMWLQQVTLARNGKPNRTCFPPPLHLPDSPHPLSLLAQTQMCSVQTTCGTPGPTERGGVCSVPCRQDLQATPKGPKSPMRISSCSTASHEDSTSTTCFSGPKSLALCLSNWVLGRSLQNGSLFSQSVCVKHPSQEKEDRYKCFFFTQICHRWRYKHRRAKIQTDVDEI